MKKMKTLCLCNKVNQAQGKEEESKLPKVQQVSLLIDQTNRVAKTQKEADMKTK
jgi:hypothetical protein